jgi:[ribosomal protein S5]-alanine N-acetyltransferase
MNSIETIRLLIRNFNEEDWPAYQKVIIAYQASDSAKYEPASPTSDEEVRGMTKWFAARDDFLCVVLKEAGTIIGMLAIEPRSDREDHARNLGYVFHPAYQGHGYATEGCPAVMRHVFDEIGADAILTGTHPENEASVRLLIRLGLKRINEGEYFLSREEWQAMQND